MSDHHQLPPVSDPESGSGEAYCLVTQSGKRTPLTFRDLDLAYGSVQGREHARVGKNNQDAFVILQDQDHLVGIVSDGCGSSAHSEVGAQLGSWICAQVIYQQLQSGDLHWSGLQSALLQSLQDLVRLIPGPPSRLLQDYLLFTLVGVILTAEKVVVFNIGDGVVILNGDVKLSGSCEDNAPAYLAYGLLRDDLPPLEILVDLPIQEVETLLIGTDGVADLMQVSAHNLPGKKERVGPISQFWQEDRYFQNPDQIRRYLNLINREVLRPHWNTQTLQREGGLLPDDTTLIVLKRRKDIR